jgi:kynureninase
LTHAVDPVLTGWWGQEDTFAFDPRDLTFASTAKRFQTGSPPVLAAYGARAGLSMLARTDPAQRRDHVTSLVTFLHESLVEAGEEVASPHEPSERGPQVAVRDQDPLALAGFLASRGVIASPRGQLLRIAFHYYNSVQDAEALLDALADYRRQAPVTTRTKTTDSASSLT